MFHKFLILCPCKVFVTFRSKVTPLESVKFQAPIYLNTRKKAKSEEPFFETLGVSKKVSCYESSLVVCLASLETPLSLFTSWIMTNFVTVEKNPVYISSMSHTKHSVKKKDSFLSLFFFWLWLLLQSLFMPYGNIVVCHSIITRGLLDMWQQWAQSKHNRNEGSVTRPRAVGRFENPGGGGKFSLLEDQV